MSKSIAVTSPTTNSSFERRRRVRRLRMIVDVTTSVIQYDESLTPREAHCLIECARKAIEELFPELAGQIDATLRPRFERALKTRWPSGTSYLCQTRELIN